MSILGLLNTTTQCSCQLQFIWSKLCSIYI